MLQKTKLDELLGILKESKLSENDVVKVYGADESEGEEEENMDDMGYENSEDEVDFELDLDAEDDVETAEDESDELQDLVNQLKDIVDELKELETMESDHIEDEESVETESEFGEDEADLEFDDESNVDVEDDDLAMEDLEEGQTDPEIDAAIAAVVAAKEKEKQGLKTPVTSSEDDDDQETYQESVDMKPGKKEYTESKPSAKASQKAKALPKGMKHSEGEVKGENGEEADEDTLKAINGSIPKQTSLPSGMKEPKIKIEHTNIDFTKEIKAIVSMDSTLSESAQRKTAKLFENAVNKKASMINKQLSEQYSELFNEKVDEYQTQLVEKVEKFLDYVVSKYLEENALAIEEGLKVRVSESFIEGLGKLFKEHHVAVPEGKVDLVEKLEKDVEDAEAKNNELYEHAIKLRRENIQLRKDRAIRDLSEGLSEVETSKFKKLVEDVEYKNQKQFFEAAKALKSKFFSESVSKSVPPEFESLAEQTNPSTMDQYVQAIKKFK